MTTDEIIAAIDANTKQMRDLASQIKDAQVEMTKLAIKRNELDAEFRKLSNTQEAFK